MQTTDYRSRQLPMPPPPPRSKSKPRYLRFVVVKQVAGLALEPFA
jgi:hypothetical protein